MLADIVSKLDRGDSPADKWPDTRGEYWALCPFHHDSHATNFSVSERGYKCFACGAQGSLLQLAKKLVPENVALLHARRRDITHPPSPGLTLAAYAAAKKLPLDFLVSLGLETAYIRGKPAVKLPYYDADGTETAVRFRLMLAKGKPEDRFRWRRGSKAQPYGLWRLQEARRAGYLLLVEGESDAQTLWHYGLPALGIPGAATWRPEWAQYLTGLTVYVWQEPDDGGQTFINRIGQSLANAHIIMPPPGRKDVSECHILGDDVPALVQQLLRSARPWQKLLAERLSKEAAMARRKAEPLLQAADILAEFTKLCHSLGLVGEDDNAKLLYLALTSRLLDKPVSLVLKGPSSSGKSFTVETVLKAFPASAYYALSSMSERALAYSQEPLSHRFLVLYEAAGLGSDFGTYLLRTLLSEGRIRYETVEKTIGGLVPKLIEREGPTGVILTTTWTSLHPENETRLLSLTVRDDVAQTRQILTHLAERAMGEPPTQPDLQPWHALQRWLELAGCKETTVPYARQITDLGNAAAVRLRRDFNIIFALIGTHAMLHQCQREQDARGRIVATLADYTAVYDLVGSTISEGVQATVNPAIREVVEAVIQLSRHGQQPVSLFQLATRLQLDKSAISRRVAVAIKNGYLVNLEEHKSKPARLLPDEPLPEALPVLPAPKMLTLSVSSNRSG